MSESIRVLVADDSSSICRLLTHFLESDASIEVVKTVHNGKAAVEMVKEIQPDVLTLDLDMPVQDGLEALRRIMAERPTPVVLISGVGKQAAQKTCEGLSLGAVDFLLKYSPGVTISPESFRRDIIAKVKAAAQVRVIRSIPTMQARAAWIADSISLKSSQPKSEAYPTISGVVIVGASTGGPLALKALLGSLPNHFPFALIIVQHMPEGFTSTLAAQFDRLFPFPVMEACQGELLSPGKVLLAPGDCHLVICSDGSVLITRAEKINDVRPSIDVTMQSAAQIFGKRVTGVVLSGMGSDGTQGLLTIKRHGGTTYAQSIETCVIQSMPETAIEKGVVRRVGTPAEIGSWLS